MEFFVIIVVMSIFVFWGTGIAGKNYESTSHLMKAPHGKGYFFKDFLAYNQTRNLMGIMAVCILLHHWSLKANVCGIFHYIGVLCVSVFLFLSGYGLAVSRQDDSEYVHTFLPKRLIRVYVPFLCMNVIYIGVFLTMGERFSPLEIFANITGLFILNEDCWYIISIMIFYCMFAFSHKIFQRKRYRYGCLIVLMAIYMSIGIVMGHSNAGYWMHGEWWYNTAPLFIAGVFLGEHRKRIIKVIQNCYGYLSVITILLFGILFRNNIYCLTQYSYWSENPAAGYLGIKERIICLAAQVPMCLSFVMLLLFLWMKCRPQNIAVKGMGYISFEFYLMHRLFLTIFADTFQEPLLYLWVVILCTVVSAVLFKRINAYVLEKVESSLGRKINNR